MLVISFMNFKHRHFNNKINCRGFIFLITDYYRKISCLLHCFFYIQIIMTSLSSFLKCIMKLSSRTHNPCAELLLSDYSKSWLRAVGFKLLKIVLSVSVRWPCVTWLHSVFSIIDTPLVLRKIVKEDQVISLPDPIQY